MHRAIAHDGAALACKLQYPDMASAVEADLSQLSIIFSIYERYDRAIHTKEIHGEIADRLREELDYELEGRHMALYRRMLAGEKHVHLPEPLLDLSTKRLLTMSWIEGKPVMQMLAGKPSLELRNRIAYNMFRAWYVPFYEYGVIHGDPHLGNYTVRPNGDVNLLDFGCIRIFEPNFVKGVIDLYFALLNDDRDLRGLGLRELGLQGPVARGDRRAQPLGPLRLWPAAGGQGAQDPGCRDRRSMAARWRKACMPSCAASAR